MNRARPMAARLKIKKNNKPRVDYEPRSAHGRAVNNLNTLIKVNNDNNLCRVTRDRNNG